MTGDGANSREDVFNAMVELSHQYTLLFLGPLTLGDVAGDPYYSHGPAVGTPHDRAFNCNPALLASA